MTITVFIMSVTLVSFVATTVWAAESEGDDGTELSAFIITVNRQEVSLMDTPAVAVSLEQPQDESAKTFLDALATVPGVKINERQNNGIFGGGIDIRGFSTNATSGGNVKILLDGVPQHRLSFGGPYFGALPYAAVEKMELVKGPFITQYGRGGLVGALHLMTVEGGESFEGTFSTEYETETDFNRYILQVSGPLPLVEKSSYAVTASYDQANGWQDTTESHHGDVYSTFHFGITPHDEVTLIAGYYAGTDDVPTQLFVDADGELLPYQHWSDSHTPNEYNWVELQETRLGVVWEHTFSEQTIFTLRNSYWSGATEWGVNRPWHFNPSYPDLQARYMYLDWQEESSVHEVQLSHDYQLSATINGNCVAGLGYEAYTWDNNTYNYGFVDMNLATGVIDSSALNFANPTHSNTVTDASFSSAFCTNRLNIGEQWSVDAGLRYDFYEVTQDDKTGGKRSSAEHEYYSPAFGAVFHAIEEDDMELSLFANWGKNFNPILRTGVNAGLIETDPETSETIETGCKGIAGLFQYSMTYYHIARSDVAQRIGTRYYNSDEWLTDGVELWAAAEPLEGLHIFASAARNNPRIESSEKTPTYAGNQIMFSSEDLYSCGYDYQHPLGIGTGMKMRYTGETYADSANSVSVDGYWLTDLFMSYEWETVRTSVSVNNLFDQRYFSGAFDDTRGYVFAGTPRTVTIKITSSF